LVVWRQWLNVIARAPEGVFGDSLGCDDARVDAVAFLARDAHEDVEALNRASLRVSLELPAGGWPRRSRRAGLWCGARHGHQWYTSD